MYTVKPPFFLKWLYPSLIWNRPTTEKIVYLTFDDGPIPNVTDFVLNTLNRFNVKATFFCIGDNIQKHPQIFERIKSEGHAIGNHTYNHLKGCKTDDKTYLDNFEKCQALTQTNLFRPPYGRIKKSQIRCLKSKVESVTLEAESLKHPNHISNLKSQISSLDIVMWDVLSGDFDLHLSPQKCYQNVINNIHKGAIIVFHDSLKAWERLEYALPKVIEYLLAKGYRFEKL